MDKMIKSGKHAKLDSVINDCIDTLYYISDLLDQLDPLFTDKLCNTFVVIMSPVIIGSINSEVHGSYHVAIHVAFYVLFQIFHIFKYTWLVDIFANFVLSKEIPFSLLNVSENPPPNAPPQLADFYSLEKIENPVRTSIFSFFKCKDDNLVTLSILSLQVLIVNKGISKQLLQDLELLPKKYSNGEDQVLDTELMDCLLSVYSTYPLFRITVYLAISKIFSEFTCAISSKFPLEYEIMIRKICCDNILKLKKLLESNEFRELLLDIFDEEWESVKKIDFNLNIGIANHNILPIVDERLNIHLDQRKPCNDDELCKCLTKLFFLMRKLIFLMNSEDPNIYPFEYSSKIKDWQCGNTYCTTGVVFLRVFMGSNDVNVKYIAEDDDFFVLVDPDLSRIDFATVVAIEKWRNLIGKRDESAFIYNLFSKKNKKLDFFFMFENPQQFYYEVQRIEERISNSASIELSMAESFLMDTHEKFTEKYLN